MVHQADRPHHSARFSQHVVGEVGGVAHDEVAGGRLAAGDDALDVALVVEEQLVGVAVQHEHAALDGAETREALRQASEAVHGVEEGRGAVLVERVAVELHGLHRLQRRLVQVVVVQPERHRVAREVHAVLVQPVLLVQLAHRHVHQRDVLLQRHAVLPGDLHRQHVRQEAAVLHLLHQGEQRRAQRLLRRRRHLRLRKRALAHLAHRLVLAVVHVAALDLLEVQVVRHLRQKQHVHQIAAGHQELRDQVHVVVAILTETGELLFSRLTITELLEQVLPNTPIEKAQTVKFRDAQSPP